MSTYSERKAKRRAELVEVDGRMINPNVPVHGVTANGYINYLCRCWECCAAWADKVAFEQRARMARRVGMPDGRMVAVGVQHGLGSTYSNHRCQCDACLAAWAAETARRRRVMPA